MSSSRSHVYFDSENGMFISNYSLLLPYVAPYAAYVVVASLLGSLTIECNYSLRIFVVSALLYWSWRWYVPLIGPKSIRISVVWGLVAGALGTVLWILMLRPFVEVDTHRWNRLAVYLRLLSSSLLVPVFEELLMRGYIFRIAHQWYMERKKNAAHALDNVLWKQNIYNFEPGGWSLFAILSSSAAFTLGHRVEEWPAAFLYGIMMTILWVNRKDLVSCVVAHATTNFTLGIYVCLAGNWEFW